MDVPLGCLNRPWSAFTFGETLAGIAAAGFRYFGFLTPQQGTPLIDPDAPPETVDAAGATVRQHGLTPAILNNRAPLDLSDDAALAQLRRRVDQAVRLGVHVLLDGGHGRPENYDRYFDLMRQAAPYAAERGVTFALKPHGGLSTTGADCLAAVQRVNHPGFRLCFDPGNLLYYAGQRPEAELPALAPYVVAMCIKDETGGVRGSVTVTPGDGDVDFPAVFRILHDHGYAGPSLIETLGAGGSRSAGDAREGQDTVDDVNREAIRAYTYLRGVLSSI